MKLLFDHNLSHKLVLRLADIFPDSTQTRFLGFNCAADASIWEHARANGFVVEAQGQYPNVKIWVGSLSLVR